jgi:hypothetical protein
MADLSDTPLKANTDRLERLILTLHYFFGYCNSFPKY